MSCPLMVPEVGTSSSPVECAYAEKPTSSAEDKIPDDTLLSQGISLSIKGTNISTR